jgi:acetoin utilization protein AcuB
VRTVGIITETDLFKIFLELMGAREPGVRVTAMIPEQRGQLAKLTQAVASEGGNFVAFGQFIGDSIASRMLTFKIDGLSEEKVKQIIEPFVLNIIDIQTRS